MKNKKNTVIYLFSVMIFSFTSAQTTLEKDNNLEINHKGLLKIQSLSSRQINKQKKGITRLISQGHKRIIKSNNGEYSELIGADSKGKPIYYLTANAGSGKVIQTHSLNSGGSLNLDLNGTGINIAMWDAGKPRLTHELFSDSLTYNDSNTTILRHPTHIAGTIIGYHTGSENGKKAQGIAYQANLTAYDWINDNEEMAAEAAKGTLIANNSYGFNPIFMEAFEFGKYNQKAADWDAIMCNAPYFQIIKAAGNTRDDDPSIIPQLISKKGYDLLEGAGVAKNVLVIGAVKQTDSLKYDNISEYLTSFSNWGPTDDGRIKPDLVAKGENVFSGIETTNSSYALYDGTSSAAASVTGAIALLQEYYQKLMKKAMRSSTVRALLINTATDLGESAGPNYQFGWGLVNAKKAAEAITTQGGSTMIREEIYNGKEIRMIVAASGKEPLKATMAWTDPAGELPNNTIDSPQKALINDLDIRIEKFPAKEGNTAKTYYPWKLQGMANKTAPATNNSTNDIDNVEKIEIPKDEITEKGGLYHVVIKHKGKLSNTCTGGQKFSLVMSGVSFCNNNIILYQDQDNIAVDSTIIKGKTITASNIIKSQAQGVQYHAKEKIVLRVQPGLKEGFKTEPGSTFIATIQNPCQYDNYSAFTDEAIQGIIDNTKPDENIITKTLPNKTFLYPNPVVNDLLNIQFYLENPSAVNITIYDFMGKLMIENKSNQILPAGENIKVINTNGLTEGIYFVTIQTNEGRKTIKMIKN